MPGGEDTVGGFCSKIVESESEWALRRREKKYVLRKLAYVILTCPITCRSSPTGVWVCAKNRNSHHRPPKNKIRVLRRDAPLNSKTLIFPLWLQGIK